GLLSVPAGTQIPIGDPANTFVRISPYPAGVGSVTGYLDGRDIMTVFQSGNQGQLPGQLMSNGQPGSLDIGIAVGHELGHALGIMSGNFQTVRGNPYNTDNAAIVLEN